MRFNEDEDDPVPSADSSDSADVVRPTPQTSIVTPRPCDILCGAGYETAQHHGNVVFRRIVDKHSDAYLAATCKKSKMKASRAILHEVFDTGARFLKKDVSCRPHGGWYVADIKVGKDKISHCLRLLKTTRNNDGDYPAEMMQVPPAAAVGEKQPIEGASEKISFSSHLQSSTPNTDYDEDNDDDDMAPPEQDYTNTRSHHQRDPQPLHGELLQENYNYSTTMATTTTRRSKDGETATATIRSIRDKELKPEKDSWSKKAASAFVSTGQRFVPPQRQSSVEEEGTRHHHEQYHYYPEQRRSSSSAPPPKQSYWNDSIPATSTSLAHGLEYGISNRGNIRRRDEAAPAPAGKYAVRGMDYNEEGGYWFNEEKTNRSGWNNHEDDRSRLMISNQQQQRHHYYDRIDNRTHSSTSSVASDSSKRNEYPRRQPSFFSPVNGDRANGRRDYSAVPNGEQRATQSWMDEPYYRSAGSYTAEDRHGDMLLGEYHGGHHHRPPPAPHHHGSMYPYPPTIPPADYRASLPLTRKGHSGGQALYREDGFGAHHHHQPILCYGAVMVIMITLRSPRRPFGNEVCMTAQSRQITNFLESIKQGRVKEMLLSRRCRFSRFGFF
jgi:hypothetical protein